MLPRIAMTALLALAIAPVAQQACYIDPITGQRVCPQQASGPQLRARLVVPRQTVRYSVQPVQAEACPTCPQVATAPAYAEGTVTYAPVGDGYQQEYTYRSGRWFPGKLVLKTGVRVVRGGARVALGGARVVRGTVRLATRPLRAVGRLRRASRCGG